MEFFTAGESHGSGLVTLITNYPRGIKVEEGIIYSYLERRQKLGGRGARSKKEKVRFEIISGVYRGKTTGATISVFIPNTIVSIEKIGAINVPRPGHIDLAASLKYLERNSREFLERASARETAAKIVAGAFAKMILNEFNIEVLGYTKSIGPIEVQNVPEDFEQLKSNVLNSHYALADNSILKDVENLISEIKKSGDSIGGTVEVIARNVPPGLGDYDLWFERLDSQLASALFAIQAVKGVEIGDAIFSSKYPGSQVYGNIIYDRSHPYFLKHTTDKMGGIEGGLSNGEELRLKIYIKPVPTLLNRKDSVNLLTLEKEKAHYESSDFCIVPSASVICEAMVCFILARAFLKRFGSVDISQTKENFNLYINKFKQIYERR